MRIPHIMKPNAKCETPQRAIFVALTCEKRQSGKGCTNYLLKSGSVLSARKKSPICGWALTWYTFTSSKSFWKLVDRIPDERTRTYIVIENPNITLPLLDAFTAPGKKGWICTRAIITNPPTILRWSRDRVTLVMIDKAQLWPKRSSDTSGITPVWEKYSASLTTGLDDESSAQQNTALVNFCTAVQWWDFLVTNDLGGFSTTLGTQALRTFRHKYMTTPILIDTHDEALALARESYHGGRTECFHIGKLHGEFFLLDVNSMYAAVMRDMFVPTKLICHSKRVEIRDIHNWVRDRVIIADCIVETEEACYAVKKDGRLLFPVGRFRTVLSGNEVVHALRSGHIRAVSRAACYDGAYAFRIYVTEMWAHRRTALQNGDIDAAWKWKTLLASFYGKWGQSGGTWETVSETNSAVCKSWIDIDAQTGEVTNYRQFSGLVQQFFDTPESSESCPAIASCITANARMVLHMMIKTAGMGHTYYVDTDSLLVDRDGLDSLQQYIQPDTLGGLRLEGVYHDINIHAPKDYVFGDRTRRKGIRSDAHIVTDTEIEQTHIRSVQAMFRSGHGNRAQSRRVRKTLTHKYDKGIVGGDGRVRPYTLKEGA